jgi:glycerol-3-phosphate acyltransferase PlsY
MEGSGNVGAANLARLAGRPVATLAFALDVGKSVAAVLLAGLWGEWARTGAGIGVIAGHAWTPWLRFRGGRGLGEILAAGAVIAPWGTLVLIGFLGVGFFARHLALGALVGMAAYPAAVLLDGGRPAVVFASVSLAFTVVRRLQGSRQVSGARLRDAWVPRLLFDREPGPPTEYR